MRMRNLLWFSPFIGLPFLLLQLSSQNQQTAPQTKEANFIASPVTFLQADKRSPKQPSLTITANPSIPKKVRQRKAAVKKTTARAGRKPKPRSRPYTAPAIEIRVKVAQDINNIAIAQARSQSFASSTEANLLDANGQAIEQLPPNQSFQLGASNSNILFENWQIPSAIWIEPTRGGAVFVGDRWYRGRLLLVAQGDKLLAVNYVDLEQYLASVVGSEMSAAAPIEALKAQAIAARSYALVHTFRPASSWYDLGSDERHQVYKGVATEYNTTHQAVSETAGQILSYQGGVVESLYGATQAIVDRAHKGVGMSQTGAYQYAAQGYDYQQILAIYYSGTEIARLEAKR